MRQYPELIGSLGGLAPGQAFMDLLLVRFLGCNVHCLFLIHVETREPGWCQSS